MNYGYGIKHAGLLQSLTITYDHLTQESGVFPQITQIMGMDNLGRPSIFILCFIYKFLEGLRNSNRSRLLNTSYFLVQQK